MKLSAFAMPGYVPGELTIKELYDWTLQTIVWFEEFGFEEYWLGEHFTTPSEPVPAPDLLLAQALLSTEHILLGPGGHCLPYHHPIELAHRIAQLDHMAQGRYQLGVSAGAGPGDLTYYGIDGLGGQQREMTAESLEIMLRIWAQDPDEPFEYLGKYWTVHYPGRMMDGAVNCYLKPYQLPHPPIALTGLTPKSATLRLAGERGYIPMSLNMGPPVVASQWEAVEEGAAAAGRSVSRADWRVLKEVLVADTDAEARRLAAEGPMARFFVGEWLPVMFRANYAWLLYSREGMTDADLTLDYFLDHVWLVGSPETVAEKLEAWRDPSEVVRVL